MQQRLETDFRTGVVRAWGASGLRDELAWSHACAYAGEEDEIDAAWRGKHGVVGQVPGTLRQTRRHAEPRRRAQFPRPSGAAEFCGLVGGLAAQCRTLYRVVRCRTLQYLEQFPVGKMGTGYATLWNAFKLITCGRSQTEKLTLYSGTATRLYISAEAGRICHAPSSFPRMGPYL